MNSLWLVNLTESCRPINKKVHHVVLWWLWLVTMVHTKEHQFQFIHVVWSVELYVRHEDDDDDENDEDDLPAGVEAGHVQLAEVAEDDGGVAVDGGAEDEQARGHQEPVLVTIGQLLTARTTVRCHTLAIPIILTHPMKYERRLNDKNQT